MVLKTKNLFVLLLLSYVQSAKILGIFPTTAPSHYILGSALMRGLAEKGHDVTVIASFSEKNPPSNGSYRDITLTPLVENTKRQGLGTQLLNMHETSIFKMLPAMLHMMLGITERALNDTEVQKLLNSGDRFDAVIVQQSLNNAHMGLAAHFKAPLIAFSTLATHSWVNVLAGNPSPTSYVVDAFLDYSNPMTFWERTYNTLTHIYSHLLYNFYFFPKHKAIYDKYFPNGPNFYDVLYNASIYLMNSHPSTNPPIPQIPSMIDIGGFHVQPPKKLPEDLQTFLDQSDEGVIYFSLGSNIKSSDLPQSKREAFLNTFSKLKLKVLWKWEEDVLPGQPENVKLSKWLPQQEILAHPNVKLFITHGGLLSTTETIYHGVPVLAVPIIADQKLNARQIVNQGFGLSVDYKDVTEGTLTEKLEELVGNPMYRDIAKQRSQIFHDRQVKPLDAAIYWVEYVIRHQGAAHLRVAGVDLPWYKYMLIDVAAFILMIILLVIFVLAKTVKVCKTYVCGRKHSKVKQS